MIGWLRAKAHRLRVRLCCHYPKNDVWWESGGIRQATCGACGDPIVQEVPAHCLGVPLPPK